MEVQIELKRRYEEKFPGEECPCMGIMRSTFGGERQFAFSMQIADEDAHATSNMWRMPL